MIKGIIKGTTIGVIKGDTRSLDSSSNGVLQRPYYQDGVTLSETSMETQKGLYEDYGPFKEGLYGFPCSFEAVYFPILLDMVH